MSVQMLVQSDPHASLDCVVLPSTEHKGTR